MLIGEVISRIQALYSKGVESQDSRLTNRQIYSKMKSVRSFLLSDRLSKKQYISQENYQTIKYIDLSFDKYEINKELGTDLGCKFYSTYKDIPTIISSLDNMAIQEVSTIGGGIQYDRVHWNGVKYLMGNRYTRKTNKYFFREKKLVVTQINTPEIIKMCAIFEDPIEAHIFDNSVKMQRIDSALDINFYFEPSLIEQLIEISTKELIQFFNANIEDKNTDSLDKDSREK